MKIKNYVRRGLEALAFAGVLFLGCSESQNPQIPQPLQPPQPQRLEQRISQEIAEPNGKPDKYGVIISGSDEPRFLIETSLIDQIFLENGFKKENIYILDKNGEEGFLS